MTRENIILGNGSNEIIEFVGHAFLRPGDEVLTAEHAFVAYKLIAALFGARTVEVPGPDYSHDLHAMLGQITPRTRAIFIANPNNPTGTLISQEEIDEFMSGVPNDVVVAFDEAYYEFLDDPPNTLRFVREDRNVIVLRTFSKIQGLANLRIGYGIARPELIRLLQKPGSHLTRTGSRRRAHSPDSRIAITSAQRSGWQTKAAPICRSNSRRCGCRSCRAARISCS